MARVVVLGRGVLGASASYHLSALGASVTCFDPASIASCATSRSAGLVLHAGGSKKAAMASQTVADVAALERKLGDDLAFRGTGTLRVATTHQQAESLERESAELAAAGHPPLEWIGADQAEELVPWLSLRGRGSQLRCALARQDGWLDPVVLAGAYWEAARALGATHVKERVAGLLVPPQAPSTVAGVRLDTGAEIQADHVVDATGCWAGTLGEASLGTPPLAMAPTRSHYWLSAPLPPRFLSATTPMVLLPSARTYSRPATGNSMVIGIQEVESMTFDLAEVPRGEESSDLAAVGEEQATELILQGLETLEPFLREEFYAKLGMAHYTAGITTYTPDGQYLIGAPAPGVRGYTVASGCNGSGLGSAGGIGRLVARAVLDAGMSVDEELLPWLPSRFPAEDTHGLPGGVRGEVFRRRCSLMRAAKYAGPSE